MANERLFFLACNITVFWLNIAFIAVHSGERCGPWASGLFSKENDVFQGFSPRFYFPRRQFLREKPWKILLFRGLQGFIFQGENNSKKNLENALLFWGFQGFPGKFGTTRHPLLGKVQIVFFCFESNAINVCVGLCWSFIAQSATRSCRAGQLIVALFLGRLRPSKRLTSTKRGRPRQ